MCKLHRYIALLLPMLVTVAVACSSSAHHKVGDEVEDAAEQLDGKEFGHLKVEGISLDGDEIVLDLSVDSTRTAKELGNRGEALNRAVYNALSADTTAAMQTTLQLLRDNDIKIKAVIADHKGDRINFVINPADFPK